MYIKNIYIESFGGLKAVSLDFERGLNIIEGKNEAGKSTVAMFIKFMLYGLSGKGTGGELSERRRYTSWDTGSAAGHMTVVCAKGEYKIERELYAFFDAAGAADSVRERCTVTDTSTGERVFKDAVPGMSLLGVPEKVFMNTVFVRQAGGKIDGEGLAEAIENILLSGDENVSTKKAAERLDKSRKALRYKRGEGGKIYELEREVARLTAKLNEAREKNAEIIELECSVGELRATVAKRSADSEYCGKVLEAYEKLKKKSSLDEARGYLERLSETDAKMSACDRYGNIEDKVNRIRMLSMEADKAEGRIAEIRRRLGDLDRQLPKELSDSEEAALRADVKIAGRAKKASTALRAVGIFMILAGGATVAASLLPTGTVPETAKYAAAAVTCLLAVLGIVLLCVSASKAKKCKSILGEWEAGSVGALGSIVEEHIKAASSRNDPQSEYGAVRRALEQAEGERRQVLSELKEDCEPFVGSCVDSLGADDAGALCESAVSAAGKASRELEELRRRRQELEVKYNMVTASLNGADESAVEHEAAEVLLSDVGKAASKLDGAGAAEMQKRKRFADGALPGLHQALCDRESRLSALKASCADPAALADEINGANREKNELCRRYEAIVCALDALQKASENLRRGLMPRIVAEAGAVMGNFTDGRYKRLGIDRGFEMSFEDGGFTRDASYLSGGTLDMAYISLRSALHGILFADDAPPAVYDESFAQIDEERLSRILKLLRGSKDTVQSLVFTCRALEGEIARRLDRANIITL